MLLLLLLLLLSKGALSMRSIWSCRGLCQGEEDVHREDILELAEVEVTWTDMK